MYGNGWGVGVIAILIIVVRKGFTEKVIFEQRPEEVRQQRVHRSGGRSMLDGFDLKVVVFNDFSFTLSEITSNLLIRFTL